eukprot:CAMPEP_0174738990 /NCGR_PEP_ID=MMETSP1094-20130205/70833_1 /TAXON_ID=156173 /ORGANISM="Chrysochromulina brevifilum, Strain UTEX LB 985" /LENGTH=77 /DNA_ID=CAMNT_0015942497 /DNA_START=41 /DNA_END=271 /DNA_ORIENTATION=+
MREEAKAAPSESVATASRAADRAAAAMEDAATAKDEIEALAAQTLAALEFAENETKQVEEAKVYAQQQSCLADEALD